MVEIKRHVAELNGMLRIARREWEKLAEILDENITKSPQEDVGCGLGARRSMA